MDNPPHPPVELTDSLELDASAWTPRQIYLLQAALVVPRPIAWVSTIDASGVRNLAPHSYFNAVCDDPPHVLFSIEGESDTYRNLLTVPEFVVNFVTPELAQAMELTASPFPADQDEFVWAGLTPVPSRRVRPFRVGESKACFECRVIDIRTVGKTPNYLVLGQTEHFFVSREIWSNGRVDPKLYAPLGRISGRYQNAGGQFKLSRPNWQQIQAAEQGAALELVKRSE
jgi:flavin reductase (DIM6/NTAB) family NADH-FMN oxidoreductase RutF